VAQFRRSDRSVGGRNPDPTASGLVREMKALIYILQFKKSGRFYVGSTTNLERRIRQHKRKHTATTNRFGDFDVVFTQEIESLERARWAEMKIKSWKRRDFIEKIIKDDKISFLEE